MNEAMLWIASPELGLGLDEAEEAEVLADKPELHASCADSVAVGHGAPKEAPRST